VQVINDKGQFIQECVQVIKELVQVGASHKVMISKMISGAKATTYIHESQMNTDDKVPGQKHYCNND
jgi:hypothetical protein